MSPELQSALLMLVYALMISAYILPVYLIARMFGWNNNRTVTLKGGINAKLSGETKTTSADNAYTELAAGKHMKAAEANLEAQRLALKTAETQERTEGIRLERARLEKNGSA